MEKLVRGFVIVLLVFAIGMFFFWRPLMVHLVSLGVYFEFRSSFSTTSDFQTIRHVDDWAASFGGAAGLGRLDRLVNDQSLTPRGRHLAKEVSERIQSGKHLAYLRSLSEACRGMRNDMACPGWPANALAMFVYDHDEKLFRAHGKVTEE